MKGAVLADDKSFVFRSLLLAGEVKPIFHCDANLLASGNFAIPNAKDSTFALLNAKNTNMLVSLALGDANFSRHLTQKNQRESVEYRLRWVPNAKSLRWPCTFHVVCVNFICVRWPTVFSGIWALVYL